MPNLSDYHESITAELDAIRNRIRNLVTHWLTDGEWKEAALRTVLRRHLPNSTLVGRGFIVSRQESSTQIDLLVLRPEKPTLFRDGELVIVTPDVPGAIAEVKTSIDGAAAWYEVAKKLAKHGLICKQMANHVPWLGIFTYEGNREQGNNILSAVCRTYKETRIPINCVCAGYDLFLRYWPKGEYETGDNPVVDVERQYWRLYDLPRLSPSYFISNLIDSICNLDRAETDYAWFAYQNGKRPHMSAERRIEECE